MASDADATASKAPAMDLATRFFGVDPKAWLEDVYNVQDDLVNDGIDAMERELHRLTRVDAGVAARGKAPARAALSEAAGAETDAQAEIVQGSDELAEMLLNAHEIPGDKFYVFAMRNVFAIPADLRDDVEEALASRPRFSRLYSPAEEDAVDGRIETLEARILAERRRRRALNHVKALFDKRVPAAEEAALALEEAANTLFDKKSGGYSSSSSLSAASNGVSPAALEAFIARATRLQELCGRLTAASSSSSLPSSSSAAPLASLPIGQRETRSLSSASSSSSTSSLAAGGSEGSGNRGSGGISFAAPPTTATMGIEASAAAADSNRKGTTSSLAALSSAHMGGSSMAYDDAARSLQSPLRQSSPAGMSPSFQ